MRAGQQVQHRDAVDDGKDTAVAAENAVVNLVGAAAVKQRVDERQPAAAVRAAEDLERLSQHE